MDYVFHSVQGHNALIAAVISIALTAGLWAIVVRDEKKHQAGNDDGH